MEMHRKAGIAQLGERQTEEFTSVSLSEGPRFNPESPQCLIFLFSSWGTVPILFFFFFFFWLLFWAVYFVGVRESENPKHHAMAGHGF